MSQATLTLVTFDRSKRVLPCDVHKDTLHITEAITDTLIQHGYDPRASTHKPPDGIKLLQYDVDGKFILCMTPNPKGVSECYGWDVGTPE